MSISSASRTRLPSNRESSGSSGSSDFSSGFPSRRGEADRDRGAPALLAVNLDRAPHQVQEPFYDSQAQPGPLDAADRGIALPREGFISMGQKLAGHADPIVRNGSFPKAGIRGFAWQFPEQGRNPAAGRVFDGVADSV